jgi:hypothetical protein
MSQSAKQRMERVINHLLPTTALEGKFGSPQNLYDRLAHYRTPGISIAVINDFEIDWVRGFGVCEAGTTREVTTDTLGSIPLWKKANGIGSFRVKLREWRQS